MQGSSLEAGAGVGVARGAAGLCQPAPVTQPLPRMPFRLSRARRGTGLWLGGSRSSAEKGQGGNERNERGEKLTS